MNWYLDVIRKYAIFDGRSRRKEYWMFVLYNLIFSLIISLVGSILHLKFLSGLYSLAVFIPGIAVSVRRLHDIGKSGLFLLVSFIPVFGWIIFFYFMCIDGEPGANEYGLNPKEDPFIP